MPLLQRKAIIEFGQRGKTGKRIEGLRLTFDVKLSQSSSANQAKITVYNLSPDSVSQLQQPGAVVRLLCGYDIPRLVIEMELVPSGVTSEKRGPDRITTIELAEGGPQMANSSISTFLGGARTPQDLLDTALDALGFEAGDVTLPDYQWPNGVSLQGQATKVLDRLSEQVSGSWWIDNGQVYIAPTGKPIDNRSALLSSRNGNLVGEPTVTDKGIDATAMLDATIRPGRRFRVESENIEGRDYIATDVGYRGDSWGGPWYVSVKGTPL